MPCLHPECDGPLQTKKGKKYECRRCRRDYDACPGCSRPMTYQWDTWANEPFNHCFECNASWTLGTLEETFHFTSTPMTEVREEVGA